MISTKFYVTKRRFVKIVTPHVRYFDIAFSNSFKNSLSPLQLYEFNDSRIFHPSAFFVRTRTKEKEKEREGQREKVSLWTTKFLFIIMRSSFAAYNKIAPARARNRTHLSLLFLGIAFLKLHGGPAIIISSSVALVTALVIMAKRNT